MDNPKKRALYIVLSLALLWAAHFLVDFMLGVWSVYKTIAGLDLAAAGLIAALCAFTGEGAQFFFGSLSDRGHGKRLIVFGVVLTAVNALLALTSSYALVFFLFLATCIGSGAFHPCAVALVGGLTDRQKGLFIALFSSGGSLGMAISQMVFSKWHAYFDGNTVPLLIPSLLLALVMALFGFFTREGVKESQVKRPHFGLQMFKDYFKDHSLRYLYIAQVCNQTIFWGAIFLLPDVLVTRGYGDEIAYGGGHFAFIIGSVLTMIPFGFLADSLSPRTVMLYSSIAGMFLYGAFLLSPLLPVSYLLLILFLSGALIGSIQPLAVALGNDLGRKNPGLVSAFTMGLVWCVSETVGPLGTGLFTKFFVEDAPAKSLLVFWALFPLQIYAIYRLAKPQLAIARAELVE